MVNHFPFDAVFDSQYPHEMQSVESVYDFSAAEVERVGLNWLFSRAEGVSSSFSSQDLDSKKM